MIDRELPDFDESQPEDVASDSFEAPEDMAFEEDDFEMQPINQLGDFEYGDMESYEALDDEVFAGDDEPRGPHQPALGVPDGREPASNGRKGQAVRDPLGSVLVQRMDSREEASQAWQEDSQEDAHPYPPAGREAGLLQALGKALLSARTPQSAGQLAAAMVVAALRRDHLLPEAVLWQVMPALIQGAGKAAGQIVRHPEGRRLLPAALPKAIHGTLARLAWYAAHDRDVTPQVAARVMEKEIAAALREGRRAPGSRSSKSQSARRMNRDPHDREW